MVDFFPSKTRLRETAKRQNYKTNKTNNNNNNNSNRMHIADMKKGQTSAHEMEHMSLYTFITCILFIGRVHFFPICLFILHHRLSNCIAILGEIENETTFFYVLCLYVFYVVFFWIRCFTFKCIHTHAHKIEYL